MPLEIADFISGLVATNPPGTDLKSQGDDHLQLIKRVLKNTFPNADRPFPFPTTVSQTGNYNVLPADQNGLVMINNTVPATLTMPILTTADAGWSTRILKLPTSTAPLFVSPPSGVIFSGPISVPKARRNIPGIPFQVFWTGNTWLCERCTNDPVGTVIPFFGSTLPVGFEWANGQGLTAGDYPEYAAVRGSGTTPDCRERSFFGTNMGAASPSRINTVISPTLETGGGNQFLQAHNHTGKTGFQDADHSHSGSTQTSLGSGYDLNHTHGGVFTQFTSDGGSGFARHAHSATSTGTIDSANPTLNHSHAIPAGFLGGVDTNHKHDIGNDGAGNQQNMPPCIICNYVLVVE